MIHFLSVQTCSHLQNSKLSLDCQSTFKSLFINSMAVSSFSFLTPTSSQENDSSSLFCSTTKNKRQRKIEIPTNDDGSDILASLLSSDEQFALQPINMGDYFNQFQGFSSDFDEVEYSNQSIPQTKRPRPEPTSSNTPPPQETVAGGGSRRVWVKNRSNAWWEQCSRPDFPEEEFRRAFRMSKATFDVICNELDSAVNKKDTMLRQAIPVKQRVAVCIWRLATGEPLRLVSKRFGLGISTCHKLVLEVCAAIKSVLMPKYLQWPGDDNNSTSNQMKMIKDEFEALSGIPNVGGSMYTTHVPIIAPKVSVAAYFNKRHTERNQKTCYSITLQGVVDPRGVFTDICIGWPGSMPDDKILEKSVLHQRAAQGHLKDVWIVGNSGYPLLDWVLAPYTHQNLTWTQHSFNEKIEEVQNVAKDAFARLKGRWSCLQKRTDVKLQDLPVLLGACCVLHNICEMRSEEFHPELKFDLFDDEMVAENGVRSTTAMQARDHIAHNLLHRRH